MKRGWGGGEEGREGRKEGSDNTGVESNLKIFRAEFARSRSLSPFVAPTHRLCVTSNLFVVF